MEKHIKLKKIFGLIAIICGTLWVLNTIGLLIGLLLGFESFGEHFNKPNIIDGEEVSPMSFFGWKFNFWAAVVSLILIKILGGKITNINLNGYNDKKELDLNNGIRNDFEKLINKKVEFDLNTNKNKIIQDELDDFKNLKEDEIIKAVYKFCTQVYIEELAKFNFDNSHLIDNYLNPTDNIRLFHLLENVRDGLKETSDSLLDQLDLDEFQREILKISFEVTIGEVEKPVLEGYLRSKKVKMLKDKDYDLASDELSLEPNNDQIDSKSLPISDVENDNCLQDSLFFYKFTQSKKGLITTTRPITGTKTLTKNIDGVGILSKGPMPKELRFGFTAISPELASKMNLQVGDELPLEITDKPVVNKATGEIIPNLYWAH